MNTISQIASRTVVCLFFMISNTPSRAADADVCSVLEEYVKAIPSGFNTILGAYNKESDEHYPTHNLPGAAKCVINDPGESIAELNCSFYFSSKQAREAAFANILGTLQRCLPGGETRGSSQPGIYFKTFQINLKYEGEYDGELTFKK